MFGKEGQEQQQERNLKQHTLFDFLSLS